MVGNLTYSYNTAGQRVNIDGAYAGTSLPLAVSIAQYNANNQPTTWGTGALVLGSTLGPSGAFPTR
jgi:uncharacterized membrane protein YjfL (UPF0719 family)